MRDKNLATFLFHVTVLMNQYGHTVKNKTRINRNADAECKGITVHTVLRGFRYLHSLWQTGSMNLSYLECNH